MLISKVLSMLILRILCAAWELMGGPWGLWELWGSLGGSRGGFGGAQWVLGKRVLPPVAPGALPKLKISVFEY